MGGRRRERVIVGPKTGSGAVIRQLWAFVAVLDDGDEAIPAVLSPPGVDPPAWCPLIGSDQRRVDWMRLQARRFARAQGKPLTLVRFSVREVLEIINDDGTTTENC